MTETPTLPAGFDGVQHRAATIEATDAGERTLLIRAVPYDREALIGERLVESFARGAFARAAEAPSRTKLWHGHGGPLVGHALQVDNRDDGLWIRARVSQTVAGEEMLTLARDGVLDEASIEFRTMRDHLDVRQQADGIHVRHLRAHLTGVALVPEGAYGRDAVVVEVRNAESARRRAEVLATLRLLTAGRRG